MNKMNNDCILTENRYTDQTQKSICTIYSGKNDEPSDADANVS